MKKHNCQCIDCRIRQRQRALQRREVPGPSQYPPEIRRMFEPLNLPGLWVLRRKYTNEDLDRAINRYIQKMKKKENRNA